MIKNIVFDFGGVLIDWNPEYLYLPIFQEKDKMDYFLSNICTLEWNLQQDAGRSLSEGTLELIKRYPRFETEIGYYYGRWMEMLGGEISENVALLEPLKNKYKMYGLTNWSAETLPKVYQMYSFFDMLDGIVVSGEEKLTKPDKRIYEVLLARYNLKASECLFIDDNKENIDAANRMGFQTIHFTKGVNLKLKIQELNILK